MANRDSIFALTSLLGALFGRRKLGRILTEVSELMFLAEQMRSFKIRVKGVGMTEAGMRLTPEETQNLAAVFDAIDTVGDALNAARR